MNKLLLFEYTEMLLGNRKWISGGFFSNGPIQNQKNAVEVFRYAVKIFLGCKNPEAVQYVINADMIKKMKLERVYSYIEFPAELDKTKDFFYLAHIMYPKHVPYNQEDLSIKLFEQLLNGEINKFPRSYFDGPEGEKRAAFCLRYLLSHKLKPMTIREQYQFFASKKGSDLINKCHLKPMVTSMYENTLEYFHESIPDEQKNMFWYSYYNFKSTQDKICMKNGKERRSSSCATEKKKRKKDQEK